jgi:hypothetical protein
LANTLPFMHSLKYSIVMPVITLTYPLEIQYNQNDEIESMLKEVDFALTVFFAVEAFVKVIAHGPSHLWSLGLP